MCGDESIADGMTAAIADADGVVWASVGERSSLAVLLARELAEALEQDRTLGNQCMFSCNSS